MMKKLLPLRFIALTGKLYEEDLTPRERRAIASFQREAPFERVERPAFRTRRAGSARASDRR